MDANNEITLYRGEILPRSEISNRLEFTLGLMLRALRKSLVICATQLADGLLIILILKYFKDMFNILAFSHVKVIVEPCQNALHD